MNGSEFENRILETLGKIPNKSISKTLLTIKMVVYTHLSECSKS